MSNQSTKLTVSVPNDLLLLTDQIARQKKLSRSKLVTKCLQQLADEHLRAQMEEGYRAMVNENLDIARKYFKSQSDIIPE